MEWKALLLTILVSGFFLIGIFLTYFFKNKSKLVLFTTGLTFIIMLDLIFFDLLPETFEIFQIKDNPFSLLLIIIFTFLGFFILKVLDFFVPEHHHTHQEKGDNEIEHNNHLFHIGLITTISLILHNILEGISIYVTGLNNLKLGVLMAISVGIHNLPFGLEVAIVLSARKESKFFKLILLTVLTLSSFMGAFFLFLIQKDLNTLLEGILLSMTLGMILFIILSELLPEVNTNIDKKEVKYGLLIGLFFSLFFFFL